MRRSSIADGYQDAIRVLSTDKEVIPARNAIGARAQGLMMNDESLLCILKTCAHCAL
jgi:hypothetical protein